jgi:hypothetical protein
MRPRVATIARAPGCLPDALRDRLESRFAVDRRHQRARINGWWICRAQQVDWFCFPFRSAWRCPGWCRLYRFCCQPCWSWCSARETGLVSDPRLRFRFLSLWVPWWGSSWARRCIPRLSRRLRACRRGWILPQFAANQKRNGRSCFTRLGFNVWSLLLDRLSSIQ